MKKIFAPILCVIALSLLFTGCSTDKTTIVDNINHKNEYTNYNISGDIVMNGDNYVFDGIYYNGIRKLNVQNKEIEKQTAVVFIDGNSVFINNGKEIFSMEDTFGKMDETDVQYIYVPASNPEVDLQYVDFNVLQKHLKINLNNSIILLDESNKDLVIKEDGVFSINLSGEDATKFIGDIFDKTIEDADNIYDEIVNSVEERLQNKYKSNKQKSVDKMVAFLTRLKSRLEITNNASFSYQNMYSDGVYHEYIALKDDDTNLVLNYKITASDTRLDVPTDFINIASLKPLPVADQEAQLEKFYETKYPDAANMKKHLLSIGYDNVRYSTSLDGIRLYGTRPSKSSEFEFSTVDEIEIEYLDSWLAEVRMVGCFSKADFEMYGMGAIQSYIDDIQGIIEDDFVIVFEDVDGVYENVMENWEFYATVENIDINDLGLVVIELIAKQH